MSKSQVAETKNSNTTIKDAKKFVKKLFKEQLPSAYKFSNYSYFKKINKTTKKMAKALDLPKEQYEILLLASIFRYTGKPKKYHDYHDISVQIASDFLESVDYSAEKTQQVKDLILATKTSSKRNDKLANIMRDAAVSYMGTKDFRNRDTLLRVELEEVNHTIIKNKEWAQREYDRLVSVSFQTEYANEKYQSGLAKNIERQRKRIEKAKTASVRKKTGKDFGRGIDTLYRTSYRNHINLSSIADGKANMMISVNTIIISAIVTLLGASFTVSNTFTFEHIRFLAPIVILLIFVLISAVFAIISARPEVTKGSITTKDIIKRSKSILFFGNFITIAKNEFIDNLDMLKRNQSLLYDNMSIDMYHLGHVLDRKYRLIKYSYNIFMIGLCTSVLTFLFILIYTQIVGV